MPSDDPHRRYYRSMHGSWRCPVDLTIDDPAFRAAPLSGPTAGCSG
jgi:hypothetical protein